MRVGVLFDILAQEWRLIRGRALTQEKITRELVGDGITMILRNCHKCV